MSRIGIFPFLGRGHLNPAAALGRRLCSMGHDVTVFHLSVAQAAIRRAGLRFECIDRLNASNPVPASNRIRFRPKWSDTLKIVAGQVDRMLREGPDAVRSTGIEYMIIDQLDLAAGSVADALGIPFVSVSCTSPTILNGDVPPPYFPWSEPRNLGAKLRIRTANNFVRLVTAPLIRKINCYRHGHGLQPIFDIDDTLSKSAVITQLPQVFDLPRKKVVSTLFHTAPFRDDWEDAAVKFPWDKLDGRPLIFASLGTVRNNDPDTFRIIANACAGFDAQLVMSLGAGTLVPEDFTGLPGHPLVIDYVPQRKLIPRASLTINCAGLNTTFDSIASGVPIVAIPIAEDQPGVACRIQRAGIGVVLPFSRLTVKNLKRAVERVLTVDKYRTQTQELQQKLCMVDGLQMATEIIEKVMIRNKPSNC